MNSTVSRRAKRLRGGTSNRQVLDILIGLALMLLTSALAWKTIEKVKHKRYPRAMEIGSIAASQGEVGIASLPGHASARNIERPQARISSRSRETRVAVPQPPPLALPSLEGLEIHPVNGRHLLPRTELFVHQGNYNKLMDHYAADNGELLIHNNRSFPSADMRILRRYNFTSCAVVGNSGSLLNASFGSAIDSHNVVLRINQAPPGLPNNRYKKHVGVKTTFRLINTRWTGKYGITNFVDEGKLPLEQTVTVIVTRARPRQYDTFVQTLKKVRSDVSVLYLSSRVVGAAHRLLAGYRGRLEAAGFGPFDGGDTPSSGFIAAYLMLQACGSVTLYGFGLDAENGEAQEYHYFHVMSPKHSKKKNSMNKTHSFNTERELLRALAKAWLVTFCTYKPGDSKFNRRCGAKRTGGSRRKGVVETESFQEIDLAREVKLKQQGKIID
mmetsp:Transcript_37441/g.105716  ORF Transcript_37441/g.105716 Transcript_37441/m.105716 type:complete len:442 (+) Transcript_37441:254-1579(+)|eukprot:CAMPEP_0117651640 /NCGR_PEP_ID=MMETSP0804-20121206/2201_1 /TAXON_ID=1074897 /ORGANISM="Tetraselmis astigmatica, Strain CCMP880" /LENGTH=441 /DNA_ID=CAMNT_0005457633 /DNA_START=147 /DNA_END=1472 /DNA_ORIENTATION=+